MRFFVEHILAPLVVILWNHFARWLKRKRFWRRVEGKAKKILVDGNNPITDAREATERALVEEQQKPIEKVCRAVHDSIPPAFRQSDRIPRIPRAGSQSDSEGDPGKSG